MLIQRRMRKGQWTVASQIVLSYLSSLHTDNSIICQTQRPLPVTGAQRKTISRLNSEISVLMGSARTPDSTAGGTRKLIPAIHGGLAACSE